MASLLAVIPSDTEWMARDLPAVIVDGKKVGTSAFRDLHDAGLTEIVGRGKGQGMHSLRIWRLTEYGKTRKGGEI
jgi:hypothetical protein